MSALALEHKRSAVGILSVCDADCPACALQRDIDNAVQIIVLEMWLEAIADGERDVEGALREVLGPISKMSEFERNRIGWSFTRRAMAITPRRTRPRKPRGLPTAWIKANREIVDSVAHYEQLPKNEPELAEDTGLESVFARVAEIWQTYGVDAGATVVKSSYYQRQTAKP